MLEGARRGVGGRAARCWRQSVRARRARQGARVRGEVELVTRRPSSSRAVVCPVRGPRRRPLESFCQKVGESEGRAALTKVEGGCGARRTGPTAGVTRGRRPGAPGPDSTPQAAFGCSGEDRGNRLREWEALVRGGGRLPIFLDRSPRGPGRLPPPSLPAAPRLVMLSSRSTQHCPSPVGTPPIES